ncbi:MAG: phage integrase SAM-like domain-containing protein [Bacteroidota bacterium]
MAKASIIFFPHVGKKSLRNGKVPMYVRILLHRGKAETRLSADVNEQEIALWNQRIMRFENNKMSINKLLNKYQQDFEEIIFRNSNKLNELSAQDLRDLLMGTCKTLEKTIPQYVDDYYNNSVVLKNTITLGTKKNYSKAIKHLHSFLSYHKNSSMVMSQATITMGNNFLDYLLSSIPELKKIGMSESSAAGNIKKLQAIFQRAFDEGLITRNPFKGLKLKTQAPPRQKLSSEEVKALFNCELKEFSTLDKVRDIFMFSVFTGLAYADAIGLRKNEMQNWKNNEYYIHLKRAKTNVETRQFLISQTCDLIEKYKEFNKFKETLIPSISNQQLNMWLKIIAEKVGISKPLSSHIARHTYRQLLSEAGIKDLAAIKTMMGHSRNKDIDAVYHNVTERQLLEAKEQYQTFLNEILKK